MSYWSDPLLTSWRRMVDIAWIQLTLWTFVWKARNAEYRLPFYSLVVIGALIYPIGWLAHESPWYSAFAHALVHILGESSSLILFSGNI